MLFFFKSDMFVCFFTSYLNKQSWSSRKLLLGTRVWRAATQSSPTPLTTARHLSFPLILFTARLERLSV